MKFEGRFWTAVIVTITAVCAWWIFEGRFRTTMIISLMDERARRLETCAWWVCWVSAIFNDRYCGERLEERGGLSMIGFEDRVYADLYKRAIADEYVNETWGTPKAEDGIRTRKWRQCTVEKRILQRNCTAVMEI
jgi:hypothetical protein